MIQSGVIFDVSEMWGCPICGGVDLSTGFTASCTKPSNYPAPRQTTLANEVQSHLFLLKAENPSFFTINESLRILTNPNYLTTHQIQSAHNNSLYQPESEQY